MSAGRLGAADIAATTNTSLYTCPSSTQAVINLNLVNRTGAGIVIRAAVSAGANPLDSEWIEFGFTLQANGVLERTGLVLTAGQRIVVYAAAVGVSATCWGFEEAA